MNADIGGGKWDLTTEFLALHGVRNIIFDPFNRSTAWNDAALREIRELSESGHLTTSTVANVLNVIREPEVRAEVIQLAALSPRAYFSVYEGDRSGVGKQTRDGWQENRRIQDYVAELEPYYGTRGISVFTVGGARFIEALRAGVDQVGAGDVSRPCHSRQITSATRSSPRDPAGGTAPAATRSANRPGR